MSQNDVIFWEVVNPKGLFAIDSSREPMSWNCYATFEEAKIGAKSFLNGLVRDGLQPPSSLMLLGYGFDFGIYKKLLAGHPTQLKMPILVVENFDTSEICRAYKLADLAKLRTKVKELEKELFETKTTIERQESLLS